MIRLIGEINEEMVAKVFEAIAEHETNGHRLKPLVFELSSEGGYARDAMAIAGRMHNSPAIIHIKAYGKVMSAAIMVLAAADKRFASSTTWFMVHEDEVDEKGSALEVRLRRKQARAEEDYWNTTLEKFTGTKAEAWAELAKKETYFLPETALALGLIDEVLDGAK